MNFTQYTSMNIKYMLIYLQNKTFLSDSVHLNYERRVYD